MDSDLVGLRTLADAGLSLNDCSDLFIHQADCDKAASSAQSRRRNPPRPQSRSLLRGWGGVGGLKGIPLSRERRDSSREVWMLSKLGAELARGRRLRCTREHVDAD